MRSPPRRLSGVEILEQAQNIKVTFGKKKKEIVQQKKNMCSTMCIGGNITSLLE